jgi:diketogulonate reductase-like aldo/keto reductase
MLIMAHRPLAKGILAEGNTGTLHRLASKYKKTPSQMALRWIIQQKGVVAIPKASNTQHLVENAGALGWSIDKDDMESLSSYTQENN